MKINNSECGICESCIEVCPRGMIKKRAYKVIIQEGCDECGECIEVCPVGAIQNEKDHGE